MSLSHELGRPILSLLVLLGGYASLVSWPRQSQGEPWQVLDSKGRVRLRTVEDADGAFRMVILDEGGTEVISLGCGSSGSPTIRVTRGVERLELGSLAGATDHEWGMGIQKESKLRAVVSNEGIAVKDAEGINRAWLLASSSDKAECGVEAAGSKSAALVSRPNGGGVIVGRNEAGIMVNGSSQSLWLGDMPLASQPLDDASGAYLVHVKGAAVQMRLQQSKNTPHVFLQDSRDGGGGMVIGRNLKAEQVRAAVGKDGNPYFRIIEADGDVLWEASPKTSGAAPKK